MPTITIEIPKKILERGGSARRLVVVDPKEFKKKMQRQGEIEDAKRALKEAREEEKNGTAREIKSLRDLMR